MSWPWPLTGYRQIGKLPMACGLCCWKLWWIGPMLAPATALPIGSMWDRRRAAVAWIAPIGPRERAKTFSYFRFLGSGDGSFARSVSGRAVDKKLAALGLTACATLQVTSISQTLIA